MARGEAQALARRIWSQDPQVKRIYLFGSLLKETPATLDFDIDLALDGGDVYAAMELAEESSVPVDLVDLNRLPERMRARTIEHGRVIYERE